MEKLLTEEATSRPPPTPTDYLQAQVNQLGQALIRKFQLANNQFNALELELKVTVLTETVNMLVALVIELSGGRYNDDNVTLTVADRVRTVTAGIIEQQKAASPIARAPPGFRSKTNGG